MRCLWWCWLHALANFDAAGRVNTITYPNGQFATRIYDRVGGWNQLIGSGGNVLWNGGAVDAEAHFTNWTLGNGLTSTASFGNNTGRLANLATSGNVQSLALTYRRTLEGLEDIPTFKAHLEPVAGTLRRLERITERIKMVEEPEKFPEHMELEKIRESKAAIIALRTETDKLADSVIREKDGLTEMPRCNFGKCTSSNKDNAILFLFISPGYGQHTPNENATLL